MFWSCHDTIFKLKIKIIIDDVYLLIYYQTFVYKDFFYTLQINFNDNKKHT